MRTLALAFALTTAPAAAQYTLADGSVVNDLEVFQECDVCPEMIVLPMGSFMMGAPIEESAAVGLPAIRLPGVPLGAPHEGPVHHVEIDLPSAMGHNEVTYDQWIACVDAGGCDHNPDPTVLTRQGDYAATGSHPVIDVSYLDALSYVALLNAIVGAHVYRLPTEAEWEYAARAGTRTQFAQGETLTLEHANFFDDQLEPNWRRAPGSPGHLTPVPVEMVDAANPWGLRHMSGNVFEWTMSCFTEALLGVSSSSAYFEAGSIQAEGRRITRGGAYSGGIAYARVAFRGRGLPEDHDNRTTGFRVLRELQ